MPSLGVVAASMLATNIHVRATKTRPCEFLKYILPIQTNAELADIRIEDLGWMTFAVVLGRAKTDRCIPDGVVGSESDPAGHRAVLLARLGHLLLGSERLVAL